MENETHASVPWLEVRQDPRCLIDSPEMQHAWAEEIAENSANENAESK